MNPDLRNFIDEQRKLLLTMYEQAKGYANIIIMGGYVGLFAVWNFTKDIITPWQSAAAGLLAIISIAVFVIFELIGLWMQTTQTNSLLNQLQEAEKLNDFPKNYGIQNVRRGLRLSKIWPYFFIFTLGTGLLASAILIYSFIRKLLAF